MKINIIINTVVRETEKAVLINAPVSYNDNAPKGRDIWMPKSVIEMTSDDRVIMVEDWFVSKTESANAFHGYPMRFDAFNN